MTLTDFLLARIAEDESGAFNKFDRRRLAECEAKRQVVEMYGGAVRGVLVLLALPYADHPDYREEWKP